jgi:hypothetical protein
VIDFLRTVGGRRCGVAIALLLAALPIRANAAGQMGNASPSAGIVRVTAGEHGEFSRVVFALGAGLAYRTEVESTGFRLVFPTALLGFDYDEVYPKRRAERVIMAGPASDADGASFRLQFGCDCTVKTFMLDERLVVDVFDAVPAATDPPPRAVAPAVGAEHRAGGAPEAQSPAATQGASAGERTDGQPRPEFVRRVESLSTSEPRPPTAGAGRDMADFDPERLERMLTWAIEHGHLTSVPARDAPTSPPPPGPEPADNPARVAPTSPSDAAGSERTIVATAASQSEAEPAPTSSCPDGSELDMAVLGGRGSFAVEHARLEDALSRAVSADDGVAGAEHVLAGFYVARLMPQEALAVLGETEADGAAKPARVRLEAAALVLADRPNEAAAGALRNPLCRGADAQLWRAVALAAEGPLSQGLLESDAILARLAAYPPDLRVELGLRLAEAGINATVPTALERLLDLVEGAVLADEARARLLFLRGRLAAARGDYAGAAASWKEAAQLPGEGGLRATLALVEADLDSGELDEAAALSSLDRLAYDWRGHPLQLPIARLSATIHEHRGDLLEALAVLEELALGNAGQPIRRAAARLASDLMRRVYADPPPTLTGDQMAAFWRYEGFVPPSVEDANLRLGFARALIAQDLPQPAIRLLEPIARGAEQPLADQAIDLLAEGHLVANQPLKALDVLRAAAPKAAAPRPDRNRLAARALAALGRFAEAAGVLHDDGGDDPVRLQADYLWKAGLWSEAAAAYRKLLQNGPAQDQPDVARQAVVRLAAAAHMANRPAWVEEASRAAEAVGDAAAVTAFAPAPPAGRAAAARLLKQARGLSELAEQYGLATRDAP